MRVFVISKSGKQLMPTRSAKARKMLKEKKAKVIGYKPFTIQLLFETEEETQEIAIGVDSGAKYIGVAIETNNKIISKGQIELRTDVKDNLSQRRIYRRSRRNRKTRYRKPRFLNRTRPKGWLPPSIQSKVDNTIFWINKFKELLPNPKIIVEVGKFDPHKLQNPNIKGESINKAQHKDFTMIDIMYLQGIITNVKYAKAKARMIYFKHII